MATSIVETITPQKAQEYLGKSGGNRNISKPVVDSYASTMVKGKWLLNGEPIVFDVDGILLNGHHRLLAIIEAGVPIQSFVTRGVEHESFATFDCGRHRTVGQLIGMQGIKHYNVVASVCNIAFRLLNGISITDNNSVTGTKGKLTNAEMIDFFNRNQKELVEASNFAASMRNRVNFIRSSLIGGSYFYLIKVGGYSESTVKCFFEDLCQYNTSDNPAINNLRIRLLNRKGEANKWMMASTEFIYIVKTWNMYIKNECKKLSFDPKKEKLPCFIIKK